MVSRQPIRRERMVQQLEERGIASRLVLGAMGRIPRESFVDEALRAKAYSDAALPIGESQTISQPWIVARMSELLSPDGKGRVLEIGSGSGYQAAVLALLYERVYSVERLPAFSQRARGALRGLGMQNAHFKIFDGSYGWSEFAPYRGILVTAAVPEIPPPLIEQLEDRGILVAPVGRSGEQEEQTLVRVIKQGNHLKREEHGPCRFVPLRGKFGLPG